MRGGECEMRESGGCMKGEGQWEGHQLLRLTGSFLAKAKLSTRIIVCLW